MWNWLLRVNRRVRPREGWLVFFFTLGAVLAVPLAADDIGWVPGLGRLTLVAAAATLVGFWLARSPFSGRMSAFFATILGVESVLAYVARILPPLRPTLDEAVYAGRWLASLTQGEIGRLPFVPVVEVWGQRAWDFWERVVVWAQGVVGAGAQQDNLLFLVYSGLLIWGMGVWAGWWVFRRQQGMIALLPAGIALANNLFFARSHEGWAVYFTALWLMLLVGLQRYTLERSWTQQRIDYSDEIRVGLYLMGGLITAAVLVLMPVAPTVTSRRVADFFWDLFSTPWRQVEQGAERMFPELERPAISPLRVTLGGSPDHLPRAHLLGGSPELGRRVALRVRMNQPTPQMGGEKRYYRGVTYADYSGRGWSNEGETQEEELPPGQAWDATLDAAIARKRLLQAIELIDAPGGVLYAVGEPVAPDVPYRALLRAPGDLISLLYTQRPARYSVLSVVPAVSEEQLRAASQDYPEAIRERFLALPEIPERVREQARVVTAGAATPYDQAVAIERYLRGFEYTLDVEEPPAGRDVVDYFLFDLQKGYCDYYASAMVVMARLVGIPARLAVGYGMGSVEQYRDEYTVMEAEAHSWPELYFPPYGWIPFEPTAGRSVFERIGLPETGEPTTGGSVAENLQEMRQWNPPWRLWVERLAVGGTILFVAGLAYLLWRRYQQRTWGPVALAYESVLWWEKRLGHPGRPAETPLEHAEGVRRRLEQIAGTARRGRALLRRWQELAARDIHAIAAAYTEERYASRPLPDVKRRQVVEAWRRSRGKLWAFWIAHRL